MSKYIANNSFSRALNSPLFIVTFLTVMFIFVAFLIVVLQIETKLAQSLHNACLDYSKLGLGAIVGLIGGKKLGKK